MSELTVSTQNQSIFVFELKNYYVKDLLGAFRSMGVNEEESLIASLQVLAWVKLSQYEAESETFPREAILAKDNFPSDVQQLNHIFVQLSELAFPGLQKEVLGKIMMVRENANISQLIDIALEIKQNRPLFFPDTHSFIIEIPPKYRRFFDLTAPAEIVKLMTELAGDIEGKDVYCPWDISSEFASNLVGKRVEISVEIERLSVIHYLINILKEINVKISISNPVKQPKLLLNNELKKFDLSIAFPPFSDKYDIQVCYEDEYDRFPEKTGSGAVLNIRHVLAQTIGKVIIAVPNSVLFSSGVEQSLRQDLLERNKIEAVISLPPALLPQTQIPFSIIVLDNQERASNLVSFVNGNDEKFFAKDGRGRSRLVNWRDLLDTLQQGEDESFVVRVSVQKVLENNSYLEVSAYTLPPERKKINRVLSDSQTANLNDLVNFIRPPLKQKVANESDTDRGIEALEVTIGDFSEYGYAQAPTRIVNVENEYKTKSNSFLTSGDILIAVKANTGKVAIVSDAAGLVKDIPWIANQSCLIVRCKDKIDPKVLFMYLSSEMGQYLLRSISSGATIPLIQLARLKELQIIVPARQEAEQIIRDFDRIVELQSQIETIEREQQKVSSSHWSL